MIFFRRRPEYDADKELSLRMHFRIWTSGWRGAIVLTLLTASGLAWWRGPDIYQRLKVWRASELIAQSEAARERGDFSEASNKFGQATALLQRHPITLRAIARYQVEMHDLSALNTYAELMKTGQASVEDRVAFVRESFRLGLPEMAAAVLADLESNPSTKDSAAVTSLKAIRSANDGRWQEAMKSARQACASPGSDEDLAQAKSILARLLLQPPSRVLNDGPALLAEGVALWSELALRRDPVGLEALQVLVNLSQNPPTAPLLLRRDVQPLMDAAEQHPRAEPSLKVGAWSLRLASEPEQRAGVTRAFFDHFKDHPSSILRLEAGRWLNQRGMHSLTLELTGPSKFESEEWFLLHLDAMAALGRWEEVGTMLAEKEHPVPLPPAMRKLFELRVALETKRPPDMTAAWRDIQAATRNENDRNQLFVAGYAEQIGFRDEATLIYRRLLDRSELSLPTVGQLGHSRRLLCYTGLLRTAAPKMTLEELSKLVSAFAAEFPEIDEAQNDHAYLQLLSGGDLDTAAEIGERLMRKNPALLAYRTTVALSLLLKQKPAAALAIYEGCDTDWKLAQDRYKAVYAAVLRAAGRVGEAERIAADIKADRLRQEERKLAGLP